MKFRVLLLVSASYLYLSACSTISSGPGGYDMSEAVSVDQNGPAELSRRTSIPPNVLYSLLVAEIALKRGEVDVAVENYMDVASETRDEEIVRRATRIAEFSRSLPKALKSARLWVEISPDSREARQALAILLLRDGDIDGSVLQLQTLLSGLEDNQVGQAMLQLVAQLSRERDKEASLKLMDLLVQKNKDNADLHFANSQLNMRLNNFASAMNAVDNALEIRPDWFDAVVLKARILQLENKTDEAIAYHEEQLKKGDVDEVSLRISLARMLMDLKYMDKALEQYVVLARLEPENNDLLYAAGLLSLQAEKVDQAESYFQRLYDLKERKTEASYYLGQVAESHEKMDQAIEWYNKVRRGELYVDAQMRIAALLSKQKQYDKAVSKVRSIRAYDSRDKLKLYLLEGDIALEAEKFNEAFNIYNRALQDMPDDSNLLYARALAAEKIDRLDVLENDLRLILKAEPNNVQALNALGYTLADKTDRYDEALQFIKRALALEPKDAAIVDSMGWVHYRMGKHQEALTYLKRAMEIIKDVEIAAHLGEVLWVTNRKKEALEVWNQALESSPNNQIILDVMRRFGL